MRNAWTHKLQSSGPTVHSLYCGLDHKHGVDEKFMLGLFHSTTTTTISVIGDSLRRRLQYL